MELAHTPSRRGAATLTLAITAALMLLACGDDNGGSGGSAGSGGSSGGNGGSAGSEPAFAPCYDSIPAEAAASADYRMWTDIANVSVAAVAISNRGWRAVAGDQGDWIHYYDRTMAEPRFSYETGDQVNSVAISEEGAAFVAGSYDGNVYFFECDATEPTWTYNTSADQTGGTTTVEDVAMDDTGRYIAAVSQTHVYLFTRESNVPILKVDLGTNWLATVEISGLGTHLFVGTRPEGNSQARVFLLDRTELLWEYVIPDLGWGPGDLPTAVAVNNDGSVLAAGGRDNRIHVWTDSVQMPIWTYQVAEESPVSSVALSADGTKLVATGDAKLFFFDAANEQSTAPTWVNPGSLDGNTRGGLSPFFPDPDVYGTGMLGTTGLYGIGNFLRASAISDNGSYLFAAEAGNHQAFGLSRYASRITRTYDLGETVGAVDISPDGSWLMLGGSFPAGVIRRFEIAPVELTNVDIPLTYRILNDQVDELAELIGGTEFSVDYRLLKPGRAAQLEDVWSLWAIQGGVLIPPSVPICQGQKVWKWTHDLEDGNVELSETRKLEPPQCLESQISSIDLFLLEAKNTDAPQEETLSVDSSLLATVQIGSMP